MKVGAVATTGLGAALAVLLAATMSTPATAADLPPAAERARPDTQRTAPVPVRSVRASASSVAPLENVHPVGRPAPRTGSGRAELSAKSFATAAGTGIAVAAAAAAPQELRRGASATIGSPKVVDVTVRPVDAGQGSFITLDAAAPGPVAVRIPVQVFGNRLGGDWPSRLQVRDVSGCADASSCPTAPVLPVQRNAQDGTVTVLSTLTDSEATNSPAARTAGPSNGTPAPSASATLAVQAAASGSSGDFTATSLSAEGSWSGGSAGGEMTWSYPLRMPPSAGGVDPDLAIGYSSGSVDGRLSSTNNQPSWVGEGFDFSTGFIERRYTACADDMGSGANNSTKTGDLCFKTDSGKSNDQKWDNATVSFGGHNGELVRVGSSDVWRLRYDDGTRFQKKTGATNGSQAGEYWVMTATDGTQYVFGRGKGTNSAAAATNSAWTVPVFSNHSGEPDYSSSGFASSVKNRAWRWNLDQVISPDGDAMTYYYATETNRYKKLTGMSGAASVDYVRGGYLTRIDYGQRSGAETTAAGAQVVLTAAERCFTDSALTSCNSATMTQSNAYHWPDVPYDQICTSTCTDIQGAPSFFTRKRLSVLTTQVRNAAGTGYDPVEKWSLTVAYPSPGDGSTASMVLSKITHTGLAGGTLALPPVQFVGQMMPNRVDGIDNAGPLNKWRVYSILSGSGENLSWQYSDADCTPGSLPTPQSNTRRCFPVYWTPPGQQEPEQHFFHKYVVTRVTREDLSQSSQDQEVTSYEYVGSPAWHYDDSVLTKAKYRTWGDWRGYGLVRTTSGATGQTRSMSETRYFRGMDGDRATPTGGTKSVQVTDSLGASVDDHWRLNGTVRETLTYTGPGGSLVAGEIHDPWLPTATTADDGTRTATLTGTASVRARQALAAGGTRDTRVNTTFDTYGDPVTVEDLGQVVPAKTGDETCQRITYVRSTTAWITTLPSQTSLTAGTCAATGTEVLQQSRTYYDGATSLTTAPTRGNPTKTQALVDTASGQTFRTTSTSTVDIHGRPTALTDAKNRTTTTAYTPATGTPVRTVRSTSPDPDGTGPLTAHVTTSTLDARWGQPTSSTAANGTVTDAALDALGRTTAVWLPGRAKATYPDAPSTRYTYLVSANGPNAVTTETLNARAGYTTSVQILDGLLRPRQAQTTPATGTGRLVTDTLYDSRGNAVTTRGPIYNDTAGPGTGVVTFSDLNTPLITDTVIDGAGRPTAQITKVMNVEQWRTTTTYGGDRVTVDPPTGGIPTTTISDVDGNTTQLRQYTGDTPTGATRDTSYSYDLLDRMTKVTDTAGNQWSYTFNLQGETVATSDPDKGAATMEYDEVGNLTRTVDARGVDLRYTYDALDRKTSVTDANGTPRSAWTWDVLASGAAAKGLPTGSTRYLGAAQVKDLVTGYDTANRPTGTDTVIPAVAGQIESQLAGTYTTRMTYKVDGSPATTTYGAAGPLPSEKLIYLYDTASMPDAMGGKGSYVGDTLYSPYGEPLQLAMGNTVGQTSYLTMAYQDGTRRLAQTRISRQSATGTDEITDYTYNDAGNPTKIDATLNGGTHDTQCYQYGERAQLTNAWTPAGSNCASAPTQAGLGGPAPYWQSWTHDDVGNITTITDRTATTSSATTLTYPSAGQPLPHFATSATTTGSQPTTRSFTADETGNTATSTKNGATEQLIWDPEGHLAQVTGSTTAAQYLYDPDGDRLTRREAGKTTLYLGATELTFTTATATLSAQRYYSFAGRTIATRSGPNNADVSTLLGNPQNTALHAVANTTGTLTIRRSTPYGNTRGAPVSWNGDHGFLNGPTDTSTGLTHLGAREYDPTLGRFLSVDPVLDPSDPLQTNAYTYAQNNPTGMTDADGRRPLGAGDYGCNNCTKSYKKTSKGTTKSSWRYGNENMKIDPWTRKKTYDTSGGYGYPSVFGKRYHGTKYVGGGNHYTEKTPVVKPLTWWQQGIVFASTMSAGGGILGAVEGVKSLRSGDTKQGAVDLATSLPMGRFSRMGRSANTVPTRLARVVPEEFGGAPTLGRPGTPDVFVTAADDLAGISTSSGIAERLTLMSPGGKSISGPFRVLEFDTPAGIASPIRRTNPGFVGGGRTAGGAREFVIPNYSTDSLLNLTMRTVN